MALYRAVLSASRSAQSVSRIQGVAAWPELLQHAREEERQDPAAAQPTPWHAPSMLPTALAGQAWPHACHQLPQQQHTRGMAWWSRKQPPAPPAPVSELMPDEPELQPPAELEPPPPPPPPGFSAPEGLAGPDAASAIQEACGQVEAAAIQAAQDESILLAPQFIMGLQAAHDQLGLPWWGSIALVNIITRSITFPIMLANQRSTARMMALNLELMPLRKLQEATQKAATREHQMLIQETWARKAEEMRLKQGGAIGGVMGTMFLTLALNSVIFISIFNGVNNLMMAKAPSLSTGGMLWFHDLTLPDAYWGLPVLCSLTTLAMIQYGMNVTGEQMASPEKAEQTARVKNIFRGMALLFIPFGHFVPSGVALLWASNSAFSVLMGVALRQDAVRRLAGLPSLADNMALGERLQALSAADPMTFAPPPPPPRAPAPTAAAAGAPPPASPDAAAPATPPAPPAEAARPVYVIDKAPPFQPLSQDLLKFDNPGLPPNEPGAADKPPKA